MAVSQRSTISAFMKTCRALYTEGLKHLLLDGVQLPSTCQITKFATFMLTKDPSRFAYLRKLVLLVEFLAYTDAEVHLVQLLSHPSLALETLVLHPAETLVGCLTDPAIRAAIGQLTTVKRLVAVGVDSYFAPLINRLPCHLESISISLKYSVREVLPTVAPFSDTLRTLLVDSEPCVLGGFFGADPRSCRFPRVQTFGIVYHKYIPDLLASSAFIETLPAITHLQLIPSDPPTTRRLVRVLGPSLESSQLPDGRRPESAPSFPSLTECSGGLRSVYALHLDCTLSTLRLWQSVAADELHILRAVLEDTRPSRLCLSTKLADVKPLLATLCTLVPPKRIDVEIFVPEEATVCQFSASHSCPHLSVSRSFLTDTAPLRPGSAATGTLDGAASGRAQPPLRRHILRRRSDCRKVDNPRHPQGVHLPGKRRCSGIPEVHLQTL